MTHRRSGYRDPESQAFIESWFGQFEKRCASRAEWESIHRARKAITAYIDHYHHRPHSGIGYRTPAEVAQTRRTLQTRTAWTDNADGVHVNLISRPNSRHAPSLHREEPH
ncbi:integrase core domain-containing protein [Rhabdothermincola sediminis]|uniref:integrase core domain-containing protein n=1 Tax=Rhabdothermincola sediminis TaxID=2751370 RepID=UPI001AA09B36|nr:integrase core domain-containing protein [Rhabdothermincola sediminis]